MNFIIPSAIYLNMTMSGFMKYLKKSQKDYLPKKSPRMIFKVNTKYTEDDYDAPTVNLKANNIHFVDLLKYGCYMTNNAFELNENILTVSPQKK